MSASEFPEESQLFYAYQYLTSLGLGTTNASERVARIERMKLKLPSSVSSLLESEAVCLRLMSTKDEAEKAKLYQVLDHLMNVTRNDYFLRKSMYIRAILNFADAGEFKYLSYIATAWLKYTQNNDTEFANAREIYALANLDQAYDSLGKRNPLLAGNYFFGSLSLTDDLESHYGFILSKIAQHQRQNLDLRYANLKTQHQIADNLKFVEALLILIDAHPSSESDIKHLDLALGKLQSMVQDRDSPIRYLLMGYCSLEKLLRLSSGYEFEQETFENAHRNLMLAYDQGKDNVRVKASALMDLGILHQRVQNHGLAVQFFSMRKPLGFLSDEERAHFAWLYSKSLFYNHQPEQAVKALQAVLADSPAGNPEANVPLRERLAFFLQSSENFSEAALIYESLLKGHLIQGDSNLARAYLTYGYSLFKLKRTNEARQALTQSLDHAARLQEIPKNRDRKIDFHPVRIQLIAYGLLSRFGTPSQRLDALQKRGTLLQGSQELLDQWLSTSLLNTHQIAFLTPSPEKAAALLKTSLPDLEGVGELNQYLSFGVYRGIVDYLSHAILHPGLYGPGVNTSGVNTSGVNTSELSTDHVLIQKIVEKTLHAYTSQGVGQPVLMYQKLKLELLWAAYSSRVLKKTGPGIREVLESDSLRLLQEVAPGRWKELKTLADALASHLS